MHYTESDPANKSGDGRPSGQKRNTGGRAASRADAVCLNAKKGGERSKPFSTLDSRPVRYNATRIWSPST